MVTRTFLMFLLLFGSIYSAQTNLVSNEVEETMKLLEKGDRIIKIDENYRDVVMLVGNTGTGKSTTTRFVAGDLSDLKSVESGDFKIKYRYKNVIGESATVSQTVFPDRVIDETNVAFYDCPGFDDTRNSSIEIATTYFIKRVVDHVSSLKFILVVNYDAVQPAGHRTDFRDLVRHLQDFIKNIAHYKDSIAMIVTKVENTYRRVRGQHVLRSDEEMTSNIVKFLRDYRYQLQSEKVTSFTTYALALIDILLTTNDGGQTYDKIGLFRKPEEAGSLDQINAMIEGRRKLRHLIANSTAYATKSDSVFGYTLSADSKMKIIDLVAEIDLTISQNIESIGREVRNDLEKKTRNLGKLVTVANYFQSVQTRLTEARTNLTSIPIEVFVNRLENVTNEFHFPIMREHLADIRNNEQYIYFFQNFSDKPLPIHHNDWITGLNDCVAFCEDNKNWFTFLANIYEKYSQYGFRKVCKAPEKVTNLCNRA